MRTYSDSHMKNRFNPESFAGSQEFSPRGEPSRILIVDDEASSRLGFRVALEAAGYTVAEAEDGEEAMEYLRTDPADLALLDLRMPLLDGMETLKCLRDEGIDVPVVVVTAHGSVSSAVQAMKLGAIDVLPKPLAPAALRQTVFEALTRHARTGPEPYRPATDSLAESVSRVPETLAIARKAWKQDNIALAEALVDRAIDVDPDSAEAHTLRATLKESFGEHHAAYQSYRRALAIDPHDRPALEGMKRYCEGSGLDFNNKLINPAAE